MTNVVPLDKDRDYSEEAAAWAAKLERGLSAEERDALENWLSEDDRRIEHFMRQVRLWDDMSVLSELSDLFPVTLLEERRQESADQRRSASVGHLAFVVAAMVSAIVIMAGVFAVIWNDVDQGARIDKPYVSATAQTLRYETAIGERDVITLPDGSFVNLNTDTEVLVDYTEQERRIDLAKGEAFFKVEKDPSRPFFVEVEGRAVQAIGTAFNVKYLESDRVEVTVTEGVVKLSSVESMAGAPAKQIETTINHGQSLSVEPAKAPTVRPISQQDIYRKLAWRQGMIVFDNDRLEDVLRELTRYNDVEFVITDAALKDVLVGGYFEVGDIDALLAALRENFDIVTHKEEADRVFLSKRG